MRRVIASVLLCALAACSGASHEIVGKWRMSDGPNAVVWQFASNGGVAIGDKQGRYTFGDADRIKIEMPYGTSVYQVEVSNDQMSFRDSTGSKIRFVRIE
jgi:hypothetical protein